MHLNELTSQIIGAAIEVHRKIGSGLLESAYEGCLCKELELRSLKFERQKEIPIEYKGYRLDCGYRIDVLVENEIIVELKACRELEPIHKAQVLTYLKLTGNQIGLLFNFNVEQMKDGIARVVNKFEEKKI